MLPSGLASNRRKTRKFGRIPALRGNQDCCLEETFSEKKRKVSAKSQGNIFLRYLVEEVHMEKKTSMPFGFGQERILDMLYAGTLTDGRRGGLVIGPSHEEGFIYLLQEGPAGLYEIAGTMEGGEYLLSHDATRFFSRRLTQINAWSQPAIPLEKMILSRKTRILTLYAPSGDGAILIDARGQFIVNKYAANRFFEEIENLNHRAESSLPPMQSRG